VFYVQPGPPTLQFPDHLCPVSIAVVKDNDEVSGYGPQQLAQEGGHISRADVVPREPEVEGQVLAHGAYRDSGDGAYAAVGEAMDRNGGLAPGRPGAPDRWDEQEARLVGEGYVGPEPFGVFFTLGQSFATQSAILSSSRCEARRSGFWWLQPIWPRSLPMWSRW